MSLHQMTLLIFTFTCPISAAGPTAGSCAGPCPGPMSLPGPAGTIVVLDSAGSSTVSAAVSGTTAGAEYCFPCRTRLVDPLHPLF